MVWLFIYSNQRRTHSLQQSAVRNELEKHRPVPGDSLGLRRGLNFSADQQRRVMSTANSSADPPEETCVVDANQS